ncbi:MAG: hypothetical protein ACJ796_14325 [Gemmatimonadaceae bacterium]
MVTKKQSAPRYSVEASLRHVALTRTGSSIKVEVFDRRRKLGELQIGQGSIFWWGAGRKKRKRLWWGKLAAELNRLAYGE